jgi:hypothetical protein
MTDVARTAPATPAPTDDADPAGDGPTGGVTFTVYFPDGDGGYRATDLAHPAALPRVGDMLEYIDEAGVSHRYTVREVVHTLQAIPSVRPEVHDASSSLASVPRPMQGPQLVPESAEVSAGLPKVYLESEAR